jgi:very-short-patch-repair endonuclease
MYKYKLLQRRNNKYRNELKNKATKQELIFKNYLEEKRIKFIFQKGFLKPFHRIVDFYIKRYRLIVEIDGGYHKDIAEKDKYKDKTWRRFKTLRILNEQVDNGTYKKIFENFISL